MDRFNFKWDEHSIESFWNEHSSVMPKRYFCEKFSKDIISIVKKTVSIQGDVLDFGCGSGYLLKSLQHFPARLFGCDSSEKNVQIANTNLKNIKTFQYCEQVFDDFFDRNNGKYDVVFFIECIEHIMPEKLNTTIKGIASLLKKNGKIIITTPNQEDFSRETCICPSCHCVFHKYQHMTQWDVNKINLFMQNSGFKCIKCKATAFTGYPYLNFLYALAHKFYYGYYPNLLYIGEKIS